MLWGQSYNIDYLGIVSTDIDQNMAKMTSDLYYTQLNEISDLSVTDKRLNVSMETAPLKEALSKSNLSFYAEIKKEEQSDSWVAVFYVVNPITNEEHSKSKEYDSFYKILMESKTILKDSIEKLISNTPSTNETDIFPKEYANKQITSTENLSGTWSGEDYIDKIVILRGGRGFVIFNNGASMTIAIKLTDSGVTITQNGRSNASFYPDLPRANALNAALEAEPMEWKLSFADNNTLIGSKKTIKALGDSFEYNTIKVKWNRVN